MRAIWRGAISFGLVNIPVRLYSATEEKDVSFHQVHRVDGGRIRYRRVCEVCGKEVAYGDIAKGYELPDGETVVLTDDDLAELPLSTSREIDVTSFVPLDQVDPIYFARSYYLEPEAKATKAYVLLRNALEASGRVAVVKVALRRRESLATLRVRDGVIVLETMLWPDEVRVPDFDFLDEDVEVRRQELSMASSLVDSLSGDFDPAGYTDSYREAIQAVVDAKVAGREVVQPAGAPAGEEGKVVDLMAALQASIDAARQGRQEGREGARAAAGGGSRATKTSGSGTPAPAKGAKRAPAKTAKKASASSGSGGARAKSQGGKPAKDQPRKPAKQGQRRRSA